MHTRCLYGRPQKSRILIRSSLVWTNEGWVYVSPPLCASVSVKSPVSFSIWCSLEFIEQTGNCSGSLLFTVRSQTCSLTAVVGSPVAWRLQQFQIHCCPLSRLHTITHFYSALFIFSSLSQTKAQLSLCLYTLQMNAYPCKFLKKKG